jgi:hypothetical protein
VPASSELHDAQYWRRRAEETRALAERMQDAHNKLLMLGIAESYEEIAKSYETLANWEKRPREPK